MITDEKSFDILISGGGIVGLCLAHQLLVRNIVKSIAIIEKESFLGAHTSGRNSGVLHAGLYYKPGTVKSKICVEGASRLKQWVEDKNLPINNCGKVIIPQLEELDPQLDVLALRGRKNGASVEMIDNKCLQELIPEVTSPTNRAIWSPNTSVVSPKHVLESLRTALVDMGVSFIYNENAANIQPLQKKIHLSDGSVISYGYFYNCSGLQSDIIAHRFDLAKHLTLLPIRGTYWQLKASCPIKPKCNLYPVPDLTVPFLGIHFTPSADPDPVVSIGPTATPAFGRENYRAFTNIESLTAIKSLSILANQYLRNKGVIRKFVNEQAFQVFPPFFLKSLQQLIPDISRNDIELSPKVGIRPQLYNLLTSEMVDDFTIEHTANSTHVLNAISPAFTASFSLADLIIDQSQFNFDF